MNSYVIIGMAAMLTLALVAAMTTTTAAYATTQNPDDPNLAGEVTSKATQDYRDAGDPSGFGGHASNPLNTSPDDVTCPRDNGDPGRCGLPQALTEERGNPQHPSEVIGTICEDVPNAPGC